MKIKIPIEIPSDDQALFAVAEVMETLPGIGPLLSASDPELNVDVDVLFAYALFLEWADISGWRSYKDLAKRVPERRSRFEDYLDHSSGSVSLRRPPAGDMVESIGVGTALALSAELLRITEADFRKIRQTSSYRTLDYEIPLLAASDAEVFEVECKGSHDGKSVAAALDSIAKKKASRRERSRGSESHSGKVQLLGVICDIQHEGASPTRLILKDPPSEESRYEPRRLRLLNRLRFYWEELLRMSPRSALTIALANRIRLLEDPERPLASFERVPLVTGRGERVRYDYLAESRTLFAGKAKGRVYDLRLTPEAWRERSIEHVLKEPQRLYFQGLNQKVLAALVSQDFERILSLRFESDEREAPLVQTPSGLVVGVTKDEEWDERLRTMLKRFGFKE